MKITQSALDRLRLPEGKKDAFFWDDTLKGFGVRVRATRKSFIYKNDKLKGHGIGARYTIGAVGAISLADARQEAHRIYTALATGVDPFAHTRQNLAHNITLSAALDAYVEQRTAMGQMSENTAKEYRAVFGRVFIDWMPKRIIDITEDMCSRRHKDASRERVKGEAKSDRPNKPRGKATANKAFRYLRAVFNFSFAKWKISQHSPVAILSLQGQWNKNNRRTDIIARDDMPAWYEAVLRLREIPPSAQSPAISDWLLLTAFTGLRLRNGLDIEWRDVDFDAGLFLIRETKAGRDLLLPMTPHIREIFERRWDSGESDLFVFPGKGGHQPIQEPKKGVAAVAERSGVAFTAHVLRKKLNTIAFDLGVAEVAVKRILDHTPSNTDMSDYYYNPEPKRLLEPLTRINAALWREMMGDFEGQVLAFKSSQVKR